MNELIYIADPMCSWCYGFREEISQLKEHFAGKLSFSLIMGGLRPGGGEAWNDQFKDFLRRHWEEVGKRSGQVFNFDLLDWNHFHYDTEPPCRAVRVVRDLAPEKEFEFFKAVQYAFYNKNQDTNLIKTYQDICVEMGVSQIDFEARFLSDEYRNKTKEDFAFGANLGIRGFPSVIFRSGNRYGIVSRGYMTFEQMKSAVEHFQAAVAE